MIYVVFRNPYKTEQNGLGPMGSSLESYEPRKENVVKKIVKM